MIFDLILLGLFAYCVIKHFLGGLTKSVFGIGKFIASVLMALLFGKLIAGLLADGIVGSAISYGVFYRLKEYVNGEELKDFFNNVPAGFERFAKLIGADVEELKAQYQLAASNDDTLREMADNLSRPLAETVSGILGYILVFLVVFIALTIVIALLRNIKIPVISTLDKWLGLALGVILGLFSTSLLATVVYTALEVAATLTGDVGIMDFYNDSYVFKFVYNLRFFEFVRNLL